MEKSNTYLELIKNMQDQLKEKDIERMYNSATTASFILGNLVKNRSLKKEDFDSQHDNYLNTVYTPNKLPRHDFISLDPNKSANIPVNANATAISYDVAYVPIAYYQPIGERIKTVLINGASFDYTPISMDYLQDSHSYFKKIGIGGGAYHYLVVWFVLENTLYVATPYIYALADDDGYCCIRAGEIPYTFNIHDPLFRGISIKNAQMTMSNKYPSTVKVSNNLIDATFSYANQCLYVTLKNQYEDILDPNIRIYKIDPDTMNLTILSPGVVCNTIPCTYASYLVPYQNSPIINPVEMTKTIWFKIVGYGSILFDINIHAIVPE